VPAKPDFSDEGQTPGLPEFSRENIEPYRNKQPKPRIMIDQAKAHQIITPRFFEQIGFSTPLEIDLLWVI
jgi:hypothetical protein